MSSMAEKALRFAFIKHENQTRINGEPYINHPVEVATYVENYFKNDKNVDALKAVAYLHDTIENTDTTYEEIAYNFNYFIASLVLELTNDEFMKKSLTKRVYLTYKMANMSKYALSIKLLDRLANVKDLIHADEVFRKKYISETKYILKELKQMVILNELQKQIVNEIYYELSLYNQKKDKKQNARILVLAS